MPRRINMDKRVRRIPGEVSFKAPEPPTRARQLQNLETGLIINIYGYAGHPPQGGPWFGYLLSELLKAPCNHCGQIEVFQENSWKHICPAIYDRVQLPCAEPHDCIGRPSMSFHGVTQWYLTEWQEVSIASTK